MVTTLFQLMPHAGTIDAVEHHVVLVEISTYAPRVGSDLNPLHRRIFSIISTHAPRVGSDKAFACLRHRNRDFNSRSPCGERQGQRPRQLHPPHFNSRPPCGERHATPFGNGPLQVFQLTPPVWGATLLSSVDRPVTLISTHAPRVGSDGRSFTSRSPVCDFNSRSPCGGRPSQSLNHSESAYFNSRSPCGERPRRQSAILPAL